MGACPRGVRVLVCGRGIVRAKGEQNKQHYEYAMQTQNATHNSRNAQWAEY